MKIQVALAICLAATAGLMQDATGSVCVLSVMDPTPGDKSLSNYAGGNPPPDYSVQIGEGRIVAVPRSPDGRGPGVLITGVPLANSRLVLIRHQGRPVESFPLRFDKRDKGKRCLFLKELYLTWQLRAADSYPPYCNCKDAALTPWGQKY